MIGYYSMVQGIKGLFIDVDIGWPGKVACVFANSSFYSKCNAGTYLPNWRNISAELKYQYLFLVILLIHYYDG